MTMIAPHAAASPLPRSQRAIGAADARAAAVQKDAAAHDAPRDRVQPSHDLTGPAVYNRVNLPWYSCGLDFGTTAWGNYGIAQNADCPADLDHLKDEGVEDVITWLSPDGRNLLFEADGTPAGLSPGFTEDLTRWLDLLDQRDMSAELVLIDGNTWCLPATSLGGVDFRGHGDVITDPRKQQAFDTRIVAPIIDTIQQWQDAHPGRPLPVSGLNLGNELLYGVNRDKKHKDKNVRSIYDMMHFVRGRAAFVHHRIPGLPVTVGAATVDDMVENWIDPALDPDEDEQLDYYTFHHYSTESLASVAAWLPEEALDKRIHLGEFPGRTDLYGFASPTEYLESLTGTRNGIDRPADGDRFLASAAMWASHPVDSVCAPDPGAALHNMKEWFDHRFGG